MTQPAQPKETEPRITLEVTRTVTIRSSSGKPSVEFEMVGDLVKVKALPVNGTKRELVRFSDLQDAVKQLSEVK